MPAPPWRSAFPPYATRITAVAAAVALAATGCGTGTAEDASEGGGESVTIEHVYGSTEISGTPERIATVGWSDEGTLLELGIVPVGLAESTYASEDGYLPWDVEKIEELGGEKPTLLHTDDGIDAEEVATLEPDLILGVQSGMEESEYEQLSQVAPTIPYLDQPWMTGWKEQSLTIGKAVGQEDEAQQLVDDTEDYIAGLAEEHPEFADKTFVIGTVMPAGQLAFYVEGEARPELMKQLGFTPAGVTETLEPEEGAFYGIMSMEEADTIDADVMVMWYNTEEDQKKLEDNSVFQQIPAVENGGYIAFTDPTIAMAVSTPNPLSLPWAMDDFIPELAKAAEGEA